MNLADLGEIGFVNHFVTLDIEEPVAFAGGFGDVGLVGVLHAPGEFVQVPNCVNDPDLVRADASDLFEGAVVGIAIAHCDYEFVANGENRSYRLPDGVIKLGGVTHHSKSAYCHGPVICEFTIQFLLTYKDEQLPCLVGPKRLRED